MFHIASAAAIPNLETDSLRPIAISDAASEMTVIMQWNEILAQISSFHWKTLFFFLLLDKLRDCVFKK